MATSRTVSKSGVWLLLGALGVAGGQNAACSSKFKTCYQTRTCPTAQSDAGAAGDQSDDTGGQSGSAGTQSGSAGTQSGGTSGEVEQSAAGRAEPTDDGGEGGQTPSGASGATAAGTGGASAAAGTGGTNAAGQGGSVATGGGGATSGGGASASAGGGIGADGPVGCNTVVQQGQEVAPQAVSVMFPAGTQGAVSAGTYVLTQSEWYNASGPIARATLLVSTAPGVVTVQGIDEYFSNTFRYTMTLLTNGPITNTYSCAVPSSNTYPINTPALADYSATSTSLTLIFPPYRRLTYTKR